MSAKPSGWSPSVDLRRLNWVGPLAVLSSIASVLCVRYIAVALVRPDPRFLPLTVVPAAVVDTAVFVTFGVFVFGRVVSGGDVPKILLSIAGWRFFTLEPIKAFRLLAFRALLVSFLPDIAVALPRAKWSYGLALAAMHVAAWAACVPILTNLTKTRGKKRNASETDTKPG